MEMTDKKINQVLDLYEKRVSTFDHVGLRLMTPGIEDAAQRQAAQDAIERLRVQFSHVKEMIGKIRVFLTESRREKAFRWLGFIQGVFYSSGVYTIEEMANHNKSTKKDLLEEHPEHSFDAFGCAACSKLVGAQKKCEYAKEYLDAPLDEKPSN